MNSGTKVRTVLRVVFSIYTAFCAWQVTIANLSEEFNAPWLAIVFTAIIVISGIAVDVLTTYYNNDFTEEACMGTGLTRQMKLEKDENYDGERLVTSNDYEEIEAVEFSDDDESEE